MNEFEERGGRTPKPTERNFYEVHLHVHGLELGGSDPAIAAKLDQLLIAVAGLKTQDAQMGALLMATLDDLVAAVSEESTKGDSIIALLVQLKGMIGVLPPEAQAKVDAAFAQATANATKIGDAVTANTPGA